MTTKKRRYVLLQEDEVLPITTQQVIERLGDAELTAQTLVRQVTTRFENEDLTFDQKMKVLRSADVFDFNVPLILEVRKFLEGKDRATPRKDLLPPLEQHLKALVVRPRYKHFYDFEVRDPTYSSPLTFSLLLFMSLSYSSSLGVPRTPAGGYPGFPQKKAWALIKTAAFSQIRRVVEEVGNDEWWTEYLKNLGFQV